MAPPHPQNIPHVSLGICHPKTQHYTDEELFFMAPGFQVSAQKQPRADVGRPSGFPKHIKRFKDITEISSQSRPVNTLRLPRLS